MNIGNTWTYLNTIFQQYYHEVETDTSIVKINYYYTIKNYSGFSSKPIVTGNPVSFANTDIDENVLEFLFKSDTLVYKSIIYKRNVKKGDKWIYKTAVITNNDYSNYEIREIEMKCICTDTLISTPKGDFICNGYSHSPNNGEDTFIAYLSENVGLIEALHYEGENLFQKSVLLDYILK
jgi:hypothetical protein